MSDQGSETTSTFDETSVEVQSLKQNLKRLELQLATKDEIIRDMHEQIKAMRAMREEDMEDEDEEELGAKASRIPGDTPAVRQRLRRLCRRRASGKLIVPEAVHEAWQNPGPQRDNLIRVYLASGCDRVGLGSSKAVYLILVIMYYSMSIMHGPVQDSFVREITVQLEKEKAMELESSGDFHTEKEMREELKLAESLDQKASYGYRVSR